MLTDREGPTMQGDRERPEPELPEWLQRVERFPQIDPVALLGLGPTAAYLAFDALVGVRAAIAGAVIVGIIAWIVQRRLRPGIRVVRWLGVISASFMIAFGIAGLVSEDGSLFWTSDAVDNFAIGALCLLSVLVGRPIVGSVLRELFPVIAERLPARHGVWTKLTILWGVTIVLSGLLRLWLVDQVEADTYAWMRIPVGWGINAIPFVWSFYAIDRAMQEVAIARGRAESGEADEVVAEAEVAER